MSFCRKSAVQSHTVRRGKEKVRRNDLSLEAVAQFVRLLSAMCGGLCLISILGLAVALKVQSPSSILYLICMLVNLVVFAGGRFAARWMDKREQSISQREQKADTEHQK